MSNWSSITFILGAAAFCLKLASFLVGPRGRVTIKKRLELFFYAIDPADWSHFPAYVLRSFDAFLTLLLGEDILSLRALEVGAIPATAIGFAAFLTFMTAILPLSPESMKTMPTEVVSFCGGIRGGITTVH
jgi:hypothetical protein